MRLLRDIFGLNVHQGQMIDWPLKAGVLHYRFDMNWNICNPAADVWQYDWANESLAKIRAAGGTVLFVLTGTPAWYDPSLPVIQNTNPPFAIPEMFDTAISGWQRHLRNVFDRWGWGEAGIEIETTIPNIWRSRDPQRYIDLVLKPAAEVLKPLNVKIVAPGCTMRGESEATWKEAEHHLGVMIHNAEPYIDALSVHVYRETGEDSSTDLKNVLGHVHKVLNPITGKYRKVVQEGTENDMDDVPAWWNHNIMQVTEWGFTDRGDEEAQCAKIATELDYLQEISNADGSAENFDRAYLYHLWGGGPSILHEDGSPKLAALEIARRLAAEPSPE